MTPMTPTTPPAIPSDIPAEVWEAARPAYDELFRLGAYRGASVVVDAQAVIARALLSAQERGKLMERERCALFIETMTVARGYAGGGVRGAEFVRRTNPSGSAVQLANAIREGN